MPDGAELEFPDGMGDEDIAEAIRKLPTTPSLQAILELPRGTTVVPQGFRTPEEADITRRQVAQVPDRLGYLHTVGPPEPHGFSQTTTPLPEAPRFDQDFKDIPLGAYPSLAASALWNAVVKPTVEFATSPVGIATAGTAGLGPLASRLVAGGFAAHMGWQVPEVARQAGYTSVLGTPQEQLEANLGLASQIGLTGLTGGHALRPGFRADLEGQKRALDLIPFSPEVEQAAIGGGRGRRQLGMTLSPNALEGLGVRDVAMRALTEQTPGALRLPGQGEPAVDILGRMAQYGPQIVEEGGTGTGVISRNRPLTPEEIKAGVVPTQTGPAYPVGGGPARQMNISASGQAGGIPTARQSALPQPEVEAPVGEHPLVTQVRTIATTGDRLGLQELRQSIAGQAPNLGVALSSNADLLRLIDGRLEEIRTGTASPELEQIRKTLAKTPPVTSKPTLAPMEVKVAPPGQQQIGGLGVKAAQERAAKHRGETGTILPEGSEKRIYTRRDFLRIGSYQRGLPEAAMEPVHRAAPGVTGYVAEHLGDILHRMNDPNTFEYAGYDYVKEKVNKVLRTLTNSYGFRREHNENIDAAARYHNVPREQPQQAMDIALDNYAKEYNRISVFNKAQQVAKDAAVSFGKKDWYTTVVNLEELKRHLNSEQEWKAFAHEGLVNQNWLGKAIEDLEEYGRSTIRYEHGKKTITQSAKEKGKWQVTYWNEQGEPIKDNQYTSADQAFRWAVRQNLDADLGKRIDFPRVSEDTLRMSLVEKSKTKEVPNAPRVRSNQGPVREEGLPVEGGEKARGTNIQREQGGTKEPSVSGDEGKGKVGEQGPRVFYRGTEPGQTERITSPFAQGKLFVSPTEEGARSYGSSIEQIEAKPSAKILQEGTEEFRKVVGVIDVLRGLKGNEKLPVGLQRAVVAAERAGYDAVQFLSPGDVGTVILNENQFIRRVNYERPNEPTKPTQPSGTQGVGEQGPKVPGITIPPSKGPPGTAGGFILPGPELIRTVSGFKKTATVAGQQLLNRLKNMLHPDEFKAYEDTGLRVFLSRPRTPEETAKWMEENGPRVEEKVFEAGGGVSPKAKEFAELQHQLDTFGWTPTFTPEGEPALSGERGTFRVSDEESLSRLGVTKEQLQKVNRFFELSRDEEATTTGYSGLDPDQWRGLSSKDAPQKMVMVRVPTKVIKGPVDYSGGTRYPEGWKATGEEEVTGPLLHRGPHLGTEDVNVLGWARGHDDIVGGKKVWSVDEVQSDWGQQQRDLEAELKATPQSERASRELQEKRLRGHPLLKDWQRLTLKSLISQAIKEGKDAVVLPDAETAMMSEGHDTIENIHRDPETGEWKPVGGQLPQEPGMRLNYDKILPKIMEELTGVKGKPVDLGKHQNAYEKGYSPNVEDVLGQAPKSTGKLRNNLVFPDPNDPTGFKTHATGLLFDLSKVKQRTEPFKLFGSDKLSEQKVGGIKIKLGERGETGAAILPPILKKIVDALTPKSREAISDAEIKTGTGGPVLMFRSYDVEKKIATSPQGIGRIPGLAQIFDPRSTAKDPVMKAILTGQSMRAKASAIATLFLEATKVNPRAFMADRTGQVELANGSKGYISDVIENEIRNPGSQPLTTKQREFVNMWRVLRKGLVDYATSEGVRTFVDDAGNVIPREKDYFPRPAFGKVGFEDTRSTSHTSPGQRQFFQQERYYETEQQGATRTSLQQGPGITHVPRAKSIRYEPDAYVRVAKWMESMYKAIADERMSNDPALQGRPMREGRAKFLEEGGSFVPIARGKIFPKEIADKINQYYGAQPHSAVRHLAEANDLLKAVKFTMDVSAPFNQGLLMMSRFPIRWAHATARSYAALADTSQFSRYLQTRLDDAKLFVDHGGSLGSLQDFLIGARPGHAATKIPVAGSIIRRSAESMNTFLSIGKLEMFRALKDTVPERQWPQLVEEIENTILSGRMEQIGLTPARATAERILFNAPSYLRGAAGVLASAIRGGRLPAQALGTMAGALSLIMLGLYKGASMSDQEIKDRFNPGSGKFLRYPLRLANGDLLETGPGNIITQIVRLIGNSLDIATGEKKGGTGTQNPLVRWLSYRGSPIVQLATQIRTGKDYLDRDITIKEALGRAALPISAEQFVGPEKTGTKAAEAGLQFLGVSTYPESFTSTRSRLLDEEGRRKFGKDYANLNLGERARVTRAIQEPLEKKKEEVGPMSMEFIGRQQQARQERLVEKLPKDQVEFLTRNKLKVPGYQPELTILGQKVTLTSDEQKRYEDLLVDQYSKAIKRLSNRPNFESLKPLHKQELLSLVFNDARDQARLLLQREMRKPTAVK